MSEQAAVLLEGVSKTFGEGAAEVHALRAIDLELSAGELTVILGPSGSGKTTLLNLIGAIDVPTEGRLVVDGVEIGTLDGAARTAFRRRSVGFVFQFFNLIPTLTARENVELVAELDGEDAGERVPAGGVGRGPRLTSGRGALGPAAGPATVATRGAPEPREEATGMGGIGPVDVAGALGGSQPSLNVATIWSTL